MLAALHTGARQFELIQRPRPALRRGEALIRVLACGICGSDKHDCLTPPRDPKTPGHEAVGIVEAIKPADGTSRFRPGSAVVIDPCIRCGSCEACRRGDDHFCERFVVIGCRGKHQPEGAFAQFVRVPVRNLFRKPAGLDWAVATLADPVAVALHTIELAGIRRTDRVAVIGAGTIGQCLVRVLKLKKLGQVTAMDVVASKLRLARLGGADRAVRTAAMTARNRAAFDVVIEAAGGEAPTFPDLALHLVRLGGKVVLVSQRPPTQIVPNRLLFGEVTLIGVRGQRRANFAEAVRLLGRLKLEPLVTDRYPLSDLPAAFQRAFEPRAVKVVVEPNRQES